MPDVRARHCAERARLALFGLNAASAEVTIRPGTLADREFLRELGRRTAGDNISACRPAPLAFVETAFERLMETLENVSSRVFVAESGAERLGFLVMVDDVPDEVTLLPQAFVAYMAVEPTARRRGVAEALLAAAEEAARERGLPHLALMVTEQNLAARTLYAKAGFATERRLLCKAL